MVHNGSHLRGGEFVGVQLEQRRSPCWRKRACASLEHRDVCLLYFVDLSFDCPLFEAGTNAEQPPCHRREICG